MFYAKFKLVFSSCDEDVITQELENIDYEISHELISDTEIRGWDVDENIVYAVVAIDAPVELMDEIQSEMEYVFPSEFVVDSELVDVQEESY